MKQETLQQFCVDWVNTLPRIYQDFIPREAILSEYRTLNLSVPRQVGKTTTLKYLAARLYNPLVVVPNEHIAREYSTIPGAGVLAAHRFKTTMAHLHGLRVSYGCMLLDEVDYDPEFVRQLSHFFSIPHDFFIIRLATDRR